MISSILIVEDNDSDRELIFNAIHTQCENIKSVRKLEDAIFQIRQEAPDVVLLDVGLPDAIDFKDAIDRMKKAVKETTAIIVVSNNDDPEAITQGIMSNASGWIVKGSWVNLLYEMRAAYDNFVFVRNRNKMIQQFSEAV